VFFRLSSVELGLVLVTVVFGTTAVGLVLVAAGLICWLLLVTFDLDRPTRGLIRVRQRRSPTSVTRWS
jgi:hypothetical protein